MQRSPTTNRARLLLALFAALVVAAVLGACGTILDIAPDAPSGGDSGTAPSDDATMPDGSEVDIDGSITCPISADRVSIVIGEVLAGMSRTETVTLTNTSADPKLVSVTVKGDVGFRVPTPSPFLVPAAGATFDVQFAAGAGDPGDVTGHVEISYPGCALPIGIDLLATRSNAAFAVTPGVLNLGAALCGTTPSPATLTILAADGGSTDSWSLGAVSPFVAPVPPSGNLVAGKADISVSAEPMPLTPMTFDRELSLTIASVQRNVKATVTSRGSVIEVSTGVVTIVRPATTGTVTLTNTGNLTMSLKLDVAPPFTVSPNPVTPVAGGPPVTLTFTVVSGTLTSSSSPVSITPSAGGKICNNPKLDVTVATK